VDFSARQRKKEIVAGILEYELSTKPPFKSGFVIFRGPLLAESGPSKSPDFSDLSWNRPKYSQN
jgi:hypothetical protein